MSLSITFIRGLCVFLGLVLAANPSETVAADGPVSSTDESILDRVVEHWRSREARIKAIHAVWESRVTNVRVRAKSSPYQQEFWIDENGRYRLNDWSLETAEPKDSKPARSRLSGRKPVSQYSFDGTTGRTMTGDPPQGVVGKPGRYACPVCAISPVLLALRPQSRDGFGVPWKLLNVVSLNAIIGSTHCIKMHEKCSPIKLNQTWLIANFWVDPARDDVIVAWELLLRDRVQEFVTIDYRRDAKYGWVPTGWTQSNPPDSGDPRVEHTVTHLAINESIAEPTFTLEFRAGTDVLDWTIFERYTIANDGSKQIIQKWDSAKSVEIGLALEQTVDFVIAPEPLKDALEYIAQRYAIKIVIDPAVIRAGVNPAMEVKVIAPGVKLRDVLAALLKQAPKPLAYRVEHGVLTILPAPRTK
jgi:hypothetical protein